MNLSVPEFVTLPEAAVDPDSPQSCTRPHYIVGEVHTDVHESSLPVDADSHRMKVVCPPVTVIPLMRWFFRMYLWNCQSPRRYTPGCLRSFLESTLHSSKSKMTFSQNCCIDDLMILAMSQGASQLEMCGFHSSTEVTKSSSLTLVLPVPAAGDPDDEAAILVALFVGIGLERALFSLPTRLHALQFHFQANPLVPCQLKSWCRHRPWADGSKGIVVSKSFFFLSN